MQEEILEIISKYGVETLSIALVINLLTGLLKLPIKAVAKKMNDGANLTRWIVFLPIILGAGLTYGYGYLKTGVWAFNDSQITIWLTASSLSLSIYAIFEKVFPSKKKILEEDEIEENKKLIDAIKTIRESVYEGTESSEALEIINTASESQNEFQQITQENIEPHYTTIENKRIILRGKRNE